MTNSAREFVKYAIYGDLNTLQIDWPVSNKGNDEWFLAVRIGEHTAGLDRLEVGELIRVLTLSLESKND